MLLDENIKEFITQCLEILIILAGEQSYIDIFV